MAGGGIVLSDLELARIRRLTAGRLSMFLTCLDEDGWRAAQELLADYARQDQQADNATKSGNPENWGDTQ